MRHRPLFCEEFLPLVRRPARVSALRRRPGIATHSGSDAPRDIAALVATRAVRRSWRSENVADSPFLTRRALSRVEGRLYGDEFGDLRSNDCHRVICRVEPVSRTQ